MANGIDHLKQFNPRNKKKRSRPVCYRTASLYKTVTIQWQFNYLLHQNGYFRNKKLTSTQMDHEEHKKHFNNPAWVAYLHPYTFVIPDGEQPLKVELSEINSNNYDYGKLCRLTGSADISNFPFKLLICYDCALAIPKTGMYAEKKRRWISSTPPFAS